MLRVLLEIFEKFGLDAFQIGLVGFCFFKLFTNHLSHMNKKMDGQSKSINKISDDLKDVSERVSTIEGRCGAYHEKER